jgi:hypothetical protein
MRCIDPAQYFGMARRDLYMHAADLPFGANFFKGYFDLWLKMMIAIAFGTMFSTFLNGPVALLAAVACMIVGFVSDFIFKLAVGDLQGGGPIESLYRVIRQDNTSVDLGLGRAESVMKLFDVVFLQSLKALANMLPNFSWFDTIPYVAYGMNIDANKIMQHCTAAAAYCIVALLIGYFFLKTREIAND